MTDSLENTLEIALRLATEEPAYRPDFYKTLLEATVYILGHSDNENKGNRTIQTGEINFWLRKLPNPAFEQDVAKVRRSATLR